MRLLELLLFAGILISGALAQNEHEGEEGVGVDEETIMEGIEDHQRAPERHFCHEAPEDYVQPNIVFVMADDLGFNDVSWNNPDVVSPHLHDLAENGIILDRNYVAPVCSPTRGSLMTGKYTYRIGMQHGVITPMMPECLGLSEVTYAERLKMLGYSTNYVGKWHLGFCNEACLPTSRGFDTFYGFYNGYVDHYYHTMSGGYDWWDNGVADTANNGSYAADLITTRAVDIINSHDQASPLYMFVSSGLVHTPIQTPPGVEMTDDDRKNYLEMMTHLDKNVGDIVAALKDSGLYDNTVFIFSSDNGGEHGPSSNYPLRGEKATLFEGGTRVPGIVHSPLQTVKGIRSTETMYVSDWFHTLVSLAGGCVEDLELDSFDQTDLILNGGDTKRHEFIYNLDDVVPQPFGMSAFRMGDFKMIVGYPGLFDGWEQDNNLDLTHILDNYGIDGGVDITADVVCFSNKDCGVRPINQTVDGSKGAHGREERGNYNFDWPAIYKYVRGVTHRVVLYNVIEDPEEKHDLAAELPELRSVMFGRLRDLYNEVGPIEIYHNVPAAAYDLWGGVWTPGWC